MSYTILTTCPDYGCQNVGDRLIEVRLKDLLRREKNEDGFLTIFREEPLDDRLKEIHETRAILMPAFPIRDTPMHPGTYRLVENLDRIRVPMIPAGGNWNVYPGDGQSRRTLRYSPETTGFLQKIAAQVERVSCREYFAEEVLHRHGITNTLMTGDPALFRIDCFGKPMHRPSAVGRVVFSPPLSPYYADQAETVMALLARQFPAAKRFCAFHLVDPGQDPEGRHENSAAMTPEVAEKNRRVREQAERLGFDIIELAGDIANLSLYDDCDLHVGYECHAHLYFLGSRRPSVLIAEDARGIGFNDMLGVGGYSGFRRQQRGDGAVRKTNTSGYCTTAGELAVAPPRDDLADDLQSFLTAECDSGFRRYLGLPERIDELYERVMRPFLQSLP